jgi:hypothetical protein
MIQDKQRSVQKCLRSSTSILLTTALLSLTIRNPAAYSAEWETKISQSSTSETVDSPQSSQDSESPSNSSPNLNPSEDPELPESQPQAPADSTVPPEPIQEPETSSPSSTPGFTGPVNTPQEPESPQINPGDPTSDLNTPGFTGPTPPPNPVDPVPAQAPPDPVDPVPADPLPAQAPPDPVDPVPVDSVPAQAPPDPVDPVPADPLPAQVLPDPVDSVPAQVLPDPVDPVPADPLPAQVLPDPASQKPAHQSIAIALPLTPSSLPELHLGRIHPGVLGQASTEIQGRRVNFYQFDGRENEQVVVLLRNSDDSRRDGLALTPYMQVFAPNGQPIAGVVVPGEYRIPTVDPLLPLDNQLPLRLPQSGRYIVAVFSEPGEIGRYAVGWQMDETLYRYDETHNLTANGSELIDIPMEINGRVGEAVQIRAMSNEFDPHLTLVDANGRVIATDSDGDGNLNARITVRFPANGTYRVVVRSENSQDGQYRLTIR